MSDEERIMGMGAGGIIPLPGHPDGKTPGTMIGVEVNVTNFTHPEEAIMALMMFANELAKAHNKGSFEQAARTLEATGAPAGTPMFLGESGLCEEHAEKAAEVLGAASIPDEVENFLRSL